MTSFVVICLCRSAFAGGIYLQAKRRAGLHRLVFYNDKFGICEQWELVESEYELDQPWDVMTMAFGSRRLGHFVLRAEVARVGRVQGWEAASKYRHSISTDEVS